MNDFKEKVKEAEKWDRWKNKFSDFETHNWRESGLTPQDYNFCIWLRDKKMISSWNFFKNTESEKTKLRVEYQEVILETKMEVPVKF